MAPEIPDKYDDELMETNSVVESAEDDDVSGDTDIEPEDEEG